MRILIAEDQKDLNRIITKRLSAEGYYVDSCFDGEEALSYIEMAEYDGIILDIMMPKRDGLSVLHSLREKGIGTPGIPLRTECWGLIPEPMTIWLNLFLSMSS